MAATAAPPAAAHASHSKIKGLRTEPWTPRTSCMWVEPVFGTNKAGTAPKAATTRTAKAGETVPRPAAATGANTKVASLSVAAMPRARGNRDAGAKWLSTARRYPKAAPLIDPATAASTTSQVKEDSYAASKAIDARANVRMTTNSFRHVAKGRLLPSRAIGMAP